MNVLSLFSGIGGIDLGLQRAGMTIVEQVEIDEYCTQILQHHFPNARRHRDIRTFEPTGQYDIIAGGFPCQDISIAGRKAGLDGQRSSLWREMHRIISLSRPNWVLVENVLNAVNLAADAVIDDLEAQDYACWSFVLGADAAGSPHIRDRWWLLAHHNSQQQSARRAARQGFPGGFTFTRATFPAGRGNSQSDWEANYCVQSYMGVTADGIPRRLAISAIGNAVVPQIAEIFGRGIMALNAGGEQ